MTEVRAEQRVALVIGNSAYDHAAALLNPSNDAQGIADRLSAAGFDQVFRHQNLGFEAMRHAIQSFGRSADGADIAVVYYAGHGIEMDGTNYLVPVDAKLEHDRDVTFEAVSLEQLLNSVEGAHRLRLVILDACRDNLFRTRMVRSNRTRSMGRGLADVAPGGNVLVAYAAKSGTVARDGDGPHSPFAEALMEYLAKPGVEIGYLFRYVRDAVLKATGGVQEPHLYGSLGADSIFLVPPEPETAETSTADGGDIFISYSRVDRPLVEALASELEAEGYSVWWDKKIRGGERFRKATLAALENSRAAIVLWSKASVQSDWVYNEASRASDKLIPMRVADLDIGSVNPPFGEYHTLLLDDRAGLKVALARLNVAPRKAMHSSVGPAREIPRPPPAGRTDRPGDVPPTDIRGSVPRAAVFNAPSEGTPTAGLRPIISVGLATAACLALVAGWFLFAGGHRPAADQRSEQATARPGSRDVRTEPSHASNLPPQVAHAPAVGTPAEVAAASPQPPAVEAPNPPGPNAVAPAAAPLPASPAAVPPPVQPTAPTEDLGDRRSAPPTAPAIATAAPAHASGLGSGVHLFRDCEICPVMAVIPAGKSLVGSPTNEPGRSSNEGPQQQIIIGQPFAVGRSEVTFEEWSACLAEGGCNAHKPGDFGFGGGKHPVIFVSWQDAKAYVAWLSRKTGASYRLLSEAEWEFAARGCGTGGCPSTPFWFGRDISPERANYNWAYSYEGSPKAQRQRRTVPADTGPSNPFGLLHVHGNVREWVEDCWNEGLVGMTPDGAARTTGDCTRRVFKGGAWSDEPRDLRSAKRSWELAGERQEKIGFRVARSLSP